MDPSCSNDIGQANRDGLASDVEGVAKAGKAAKHAPTEGAQLREGTDTAVLPAVKTAKAKKEAHTATAGDLTSAISGNAPTGSQATILAAGGVLVVAAAVIGFRRQKSKQSALVSTCLL